jgi:molybdate transport system substrate-binding protein
MKFIPSLALLGVLLLAAAPGAMAQEQITLVAPGGARAAIEGLIPGFEAKTGIKVKATYGSGLGTKKQVAQGDVFDIQVVQPPFPAVLASGNVVVKSQTPLASVAVGVVVKKGAAKPDISTAAAVKKMLLAATSVTYPDPSGGAAAGVSFDKTLAQLGIAKEVQAKIKRAQGGAGAMKLVADGQVEIGLTFLSEMQEPGIDLLGPLPAEISVPTRLVGFVSSHTKDAKAATALLKYLSSPEAAKVYRANGMHPDHG